MENKRAAQQKRAEEREKARKKALYSKLAIGCAIVAVVVLLVIVTALDKGGSEADADAAETAQVEETDPTPGDDDQTADATVTEEGGENDLDTTEGREVKEGDVVRIDFVGTYADSGEEFAGGNSNGAGYDLEIGSGTFIPGFEDGLIGKKVGETVDLPLTFPEDYGSAELAGVDVVFAVTIHGIYNN